MIEASKESYSLALRQTQGTLTEEVPDWEPWVLFFLRALQRQKARLEAKVAREQAWRTALPALSVQILELAREHGRVTTAQVKSGILARYGQGRATWYALP